MYTINSNVITNEALLSREHGLMCVVYPYVMDNVFPGSFVSLISNQSILLISHANSCHLHNNREVVTHVGGDLYMLVTVVL